jgi:hypothetical protein
LPTNTKGTQAGHGQLGAAQAIRLKSLTNRITQAIDGIRSMNLYPDAAAAGAQLTKTRKSRTKKQKQSTA